METVGILVVSYGSRAASFVDAFSRSNAYETKLYIADKQKNPFNVKRAEEHRVIHDLNIDKITEFVEKYREKIDFGIIGPEGPIIDGVRDKIEEKIEIPIICPTKEFALEYSKVKQRNLLKECCPEVNPRFRVFDKKDYNNQDEVRRDVYSWLDELDNEAVVKPDRPGYGKGVGVWGDHFNSREDLFKHFLSIYENDSVIIEEKIDGEESSFQAFCDGKSLAVLPETRDYKRAFENDEGPNTGGMGCYTDKDFLPFMKKEDKEREIEIANKIFKKLRGNGSNPSLRGIPFYIAFIHSSEGPKILEINSRGGDPEIQTVIPLIKDDFVDVCFDMINGNLSKVSMEEKSGVLIYKVPPTYGGYDKRFPELVNIGEVGKPVDLGNAYRLIERYGDDIRIYPGSMEIRDDSKTYSGSSRTVCCIGYSNTIEEAREIAMEGINSIKGGALWYRRDIASKEHIQRSIEHMERLGELAH